MYNLKNDPSELINVVKTHPKEHKKLLISWNDYTSKHGFKNDKDWNMPTGDIKRGWGYDRMSKGLIKTAPEYMSDHVALNQKLTLTFESQITFAGTNGKSIRLQKYGDPRIIWSKDLNEQSEFEGKKEIIFQDFPTLEPDSHYYLTWDAGWAQYFEKGKWKPISAVRESAYAFRFKTTK